ncbi:MAG: tetratricopeptide repeat protein [Candidatus Brocadiae bacterium]|nr:tetratricopeptide repeat protein [Candidatus Brocadiia bacterium]
MKIFFLFAFLVASFWNAGCVSKNPPHKKIESSARKIQPEVVIIPSLKKNIAEQEEYQGKYQKDARFLSLMAQASQEKEKTFDLFSRKTGILGTKKEKFLLAFQDYAGKGSAVSSIATSFDKEARRWTIKLTTEHFLTCRENLALLVRLRLLEAILEEKGMNEKMPFWFRWGIIYWIAQEEISLLDIFARKVLEDGRTLPEILKGAIHKECSFPEWEGFLAFVFLQNYYSEGKEKVKLYINRILEQGKDWESELQEVFQIPSYMWHEKSLPFSLTYFSQQYRPAWLGYRKALKLYLQKNYNESIPQWKKLYLQYPEGFMTGNVLFWLGMCYYRIEQYSTALEYFEKILKQFPCQCDHAAPLYYRKALCHYYQKNIPLAIAHLDDFIRDFPDHDLGQNAYFFLAEALVEQNQHRRATLVYEEFLQKFPLHTREKEATLAISEISMKLGWFQKAKKYNKALLSLKNTSSIEKEKSKEMLAAIDWVEKNPLDQALSQRMESVFQGFSEKNLAEKKALLMELSCIGKIAFPFVQSLKKEKEDVLLYAIDALQSIESLETSEFLLDILWQNPQMSNKILLALIQINIPFYSLQSRIKEQSLPPEKTKQIQESWQELSLGSGVSLQRKFPDLLKKLHSYPQDRLAMLQRLAVEANQEQIPLLLKIAEKEQNVVVKTQALKNLLLFPDNIQSNMLENFLTDQDVQIQILAVQGLGVIKEYPLSLIKPILKSSSPELKLAALEILSNAPDPIYWLAMTEEMEDGRVQVRNKIKDLVLKMPPNKILPVVLDSFVQEQKPLYFYTALVELIEKITKKSFLYNPDMTKEERKKLTERILSTWK